MDQPEALWSGTWWLGGARKIRFTLAIRTLAIVAAALMPLLGVIIYNEVALRTSREEEVRGLALQTAEQTALELERLRSGAQTLLEVIAAAPVVSSNDQAGCEKYLGRVLERLPQYLSVAILANDGTVRCRSDGKRSDLNLSDRLYFINAIERPLELVIGDYTASRESEAATLPLAFAYGGDRPMVAVASLNLQWLQGAVQNRQLPPDGSITIADHQGTIIARAPFPERFVGTSIPEQFMALVNASQPGTEELTSQDGTRRYIGYIPPSVAPHGLYVSVGVGKNAAFAEINAASLRTALMTFAALGIATGLGTLLTRSLVTGRIRRIGSAISARRKGDLAARSGLRRGGSELDDLGAALDEYLDQVAEAQRQQLAAEKHREMLSRELAHRLKNLLATVQGIAFQTFRAPSMRDQLTEFEGRLRSIAAAQDLLLTDATESVDLRATISSAVAPFQGRPGEKFMLQGPDLKVPSRACVSLALAFHELATNATKYGALSAPAGQVEIIWTVASGELTIKWRESGGPEVTTPTKRGFGSRMIEQLLAAELKGKAKISYDPTGLTCVIKAPIDPLP